MPVTKKFDREAYEKKLNSMTKEQKEDFLKNWNAGMDSKDNPKNKQTPKKK